jgi:hypothetical protein
MLLERVRFTLDGLECNKIGVGYEAYRNQPNFCSSPFWSCLYNQLWNFWEVRWFEVTNVKFLVAETWYADILIFYYWICFDHSFQADDNRINRNQEPQYIVQGRFERINQHPVRFSPFTSRVPLLCVLDNTFDKYLLQHAGVHSFSFGITELVNTNLLIELSADDIEYVYQRYWSCLCIYNWVYSNLFLIC